MMTNSGYTDGRSIYCSHMIENFNFGQ